MPENKCQQLEDIRDSHHKPYMWRHSVAILKVAEDFSPYSVALHGRLKARDPDTAYRRIKGYQEQGCSSIKMIRTVAEKLGRSTARAEVAKSLRESELISSQWWTILPLCIIQPNQDLPISKISKSLTRKNYFGQSGLNLRKMKYYFCAFGNFPLPVK